MKNYLTEQEEFWNGSFGNSYVERSKCTKGIASRLHAFDKIFTNTERIDSCLELGTNVGLNLQAIKLLLPEASIAGVEINKKAAAECRKINGVEMFEESILTFNSEKKWDLTFTSGVLIHIHPDFLEQAYEVLYNCSNKYICVIEYYNPTPVEVLYHGHTEKLFKRDFAGELMDKYSDLKLINYGFIYNRDTHFPTDDHNWFLLKK